MAIPDDTVTGRTPWDVVALVVIKLGTTTVLTAAILIAGWYGFREYRTIQTDLTESNANIEKERQKARTDAEAALVANTQVMGRMSGDLMINIQAMLDLNKKINLELAATQNARDLAHAEAMAAKLAKEETEAEAERVRLEIAEMQAQLDAATASLTEIELKSKQARATTNKLNAGIDNLYNAQRRDLDQVNVRNQELESIRNMLVGQLEAREEKLAMLADELNAGRDQTNPDESSLRAARLLRAFADDPDHMLSGEAIAAIRALNVEVFKEVVSTDGLGFKIWMYIARENRRSGFIYGYVDQTTLGPSDYLRISFNRDRVTKVEHRLANALFRVPTLWNWYSTEVVDFMVLQDGKQRLSFVSIEDDVWDQLSLGPIHNHPITELLFGRDNFKPFQIGAYTDIADSWPDRWEDALAGNYKLEKVLDAMARSESYSAEGFNGIALLEAEIGLREAVQRLLEASVNRSVTELAILAPNIEFENFGRIAAFALNADAAIKGFELTTVQGAETTGSAVRVTLTAPPGRLTRGGKGYLTLVERASGWVLIDFRLPIG